MAAQTPCTAMPGQVRITTVTAAMPATLVAHQHRRVTPAIEKDHRLLLPIDGFGDSFQGSRSQALKRGLLAQVQHPPLRKRGFGRTFAQAVPGVFSTRSITQ